MKTRFLFIFLLLGFKINCKTLPRPITFAISESKVVKEIPEKDRDFAFIIPGKLDTYIYTEETDYYNDYKRSYFAVTCKKWGWDCLRHYEILACGCIPYFTDIYLCDENVLFCFPKQLIKEAMNLPGVSYLKIDHSKFDKTKYNEILNKLLDYTRKTITTKAIAQYLLTSVKYNGGKILYLSNDVAPDYMRCLLLTGLKELLGEKVIDVPKIDHLYKNYVHDIKKIYGKGFSYTKIIDDLIINRDYIEERIKNKEFELIIYGSVHRGLRFYDLVTQYYNEDQIIYICGEDSHNCQYKHLSNLFIREFC